jgi:hypothetical protein
MDHQILKPKKIDMEIISERLDAIEKKIGTS